MNICIDICHSNSKQDSEALMIGCSTYHEQNQPQIQPPAQKKQQRHKKRFVKENQYNWNDTENRRYINFLINHGDLLSLPNEEKKKRKVNVIMSRAVQSRNSTQCHTHHQKMIAKYGSIEAVIAQFQYLVRGVKKTEEKAEVKLETIEQEKLIPYEELLLEREVPDLLLEPLFEFYESPAVYSNEEFEFGYLFSF